jgi:inner membrane protein
MMFPTHLILGFALGAALRLQLIIATIAGVIADADVIFYLASPGFPFIHRGIFHTPIVLSVILIGLYLATKRKDVTLAFGAGFLGHLFLDTLNPTGIMWLYPLPVFLSLNLAHYSNILANAAIILLSAGLVLVARKEWIQRIDALFRHPRKVI